MLPPLSAWWWDTTGSAAGRLSPTSDSCWLPWGSPACSWLLTLVYHFQVGSVAFTGTGWVRLVYFAILVSHIILAAAILPLAVITLYRALHEQFESHKRLARWTLPIWLYVSVTGVIIYWMLYH